MTTINCQKSRPGCRVKSVQNLSTGEKRPKQVPLRSLSFSNLTEKSTEPSTPKSQQRSSKSTQLESIVFAQTLQLSSLQSQNEKLSKILANLELKEQKIQKKQNLLCFKNSSEDSKIRTLKQKCEDLGKNCESLVKTLENLSKVDKTPDQRFKDNALLGQIDKDVKVNKELKLMLRVLKHKVMFGKMKSAIKKQLREKQGQQIKVMEKIVSFLLNKVENTQNSSLAASCVFNLGMGKTVVTSVCDAKEYWKGKEKEIMGQIIEEKQNIEVFQNLCRKDRENKGFEQIKCKNLKVLEGLKGVGKENENKIEVLKNKQEVLKNLQAMLKFWIQEYANVSSFTYEADEEVENI